MASSLIAFRASGDFLDWLSSQCAPGESVSQAAQRLLRPASESVNSSAPDFDSLLGRLEEVEARLSKLEHPSDFGFSVGAKQLTIFDALDEVEASLKSSDGLGFSIEDEENYLCREDLERIRADYDALLESSERIITKLRGEVQELRSKLEIERRDREEVEEKLIQAEGELIDANLDLRLPDSSALLNSLKARRKNTRVTLADIEEIFKLL